MLKSLLFCCLVSTFVATAYACNGCSIKKFVVKPCPGTEKSNVIQVQLTTLVLDKNCMVKSQGSLNVVKTVKELSSKWNFQKGLLKKSGESDGCKELEKASRDKESANFMKLFGMPDKCPINKGVRKLNKEANVSKFKDKLPLLHGPFNGKMDISHGSVGRSCYTLDGVIDCKSG